MVILHINGSLFESFGEIYYEIDRATKVKEIAKKKGLLVRCVKHFNRGDPFWIVYTAKPKKLVRRRK